MQDEQTQSDVNNQGNLNDEISQQLAGIQAGGDDTAPGYQRTNLDSPVAQPGATVSPPAFEPPADPDLEQAQTEAAQVQDMVNPQTDTPPDLNAQANNPSAVVEPPQDDNVDQTTEDAINQAVSSVGQAEPEVPAEEPETEAQSSVEPAENPVEPVDEPEEDDSQEPEPETEEEPPTVPAPTGNVADDELSDIKRKAIQELAPMVDKLDLAPEKRYDVLMEMIQATDNRDLVPEAYEAAHAIEDEDLKAQALLEIINEVDYLTNNNSEK